MSQILIIEDEIIVAKDIEQILLEQGYDVIGIASTYEKARLKLQTESPDLILCDINLNGEKTGIDLMMEFEAKLQVPFIFISAYSDVETLKKAYSIAPKNYITKPFNEKQLLASIQAVLLEEKSSGEPSPRELSIIKLLARGKGNKEIAEELNISFFTVETHRKNIIKKFDVQTTAELIWQFTKAGTFDFSCLIPGHRPAGMFGTIVVD